MHSIRYKYQIFIRQVRDSNTIPRPFLNAAPFISMCYSVAQCKAPVTQTQLQVCWIPSKPFPDLAQVWLYKQTAVAEGSTVCSHCVMSYCCIPWVKVVPCAVGSPSPSWPPMLCALWSSVPNKATAVHRKGRRVPHKRVMTVPTQLWHNALNTLL